MVSLINLDSRFSTKSWLPKRIGRFLADVSDKILQLDGFVNQLIDEMKKIDAFKRELPLCMLIITDSAIRSSFFSGFRNYDSSGGDALSESGKKNGFVPLLPVMKDMDELPLSLCTPGIKNSINPALPDQDQAHLLGSNGDACRLIFVNALQHLGGPQEVSAAHEKNPPNLLVREQFGESLEHSNGSPEGPLHLSSDTLDEE
ncbi:hypothetical protein SASPL_116180 [Salvia splendens]|uniref:HHO5-like N-terminal domain-containing protein n=1 Tax=Salvia splendens TaxID=180675 RepID=A0A8X8XY89_SALSN|nr:hypothetical protein SASPL_116180 [Salvia splendens]